MCDASDKGNGVEELKATVEELKTTVESNVGKLGTLEEVILPELMDRLLRLERGGGQDRRVADGEELLDEDEGRKLEDASKSEEEDNGGGDCGSGSGNNTGARDNTGAGESGSGNNVEKIEEPAPSIAETLEILKVARRGIMGKRDARFHGRWLVEDLASHDSVYVGPWLKFLIAERGLERAEVAAREEISMAGDRVLQGLKSATPQARANARTSSVLPRELLAQELERRREGGSLLLFEHRLVDVCSFDRAVKEETFVRYSGVGGGGEREAGDEAMADLERSLMCTGTRQVSGEHFLYVGKNEYRAIGERLAGVGRTVDLRYWGEQTSKLAYGMARRLKLERGAGDVAGNWSMTGERMGLVVMLGAVGAAVAENRSRAAYLRDCADYHGGYQVLCPILR